MGADISVRVAPPAPVDHVVLHDHMPCDLVFNVCST